MLGGSVSRLQYHMRNERRKGSRTIVRRISHMRVIDQSAYSTIYRLEASCQFSPEDIFRRKTVRLLITWYGVNVSVAKIRLSAPLTSDHIVHQQLIAMPALQLGLPDMVMRIDKPWRHNLSLAVDDFRPRRGCEVRSNLCNLVSLDEEVCVLQRDDLVVFGKSEDSAALEEDGCGRHDGSWQRVLKSILSLDSYF
jgi:hypothetical protein